MPHLPLLTLFGLKMLAAQGQQMLYLQHIAHACIRAALQGDLAVPRYPLIQRLGHLRIQNASAIGGQNGERVSHCHTILSGAQDWVDMVKVNVLTVEAH